MSFNINTSTLNSTGNVNIGGSATVASSLSTNGSFNVLGSNISTLGGNLICNTNVFIPNITKLSREERVSELFYDQTFEKIVCRPTDFNYKRVLDDRFEYISTDWIAVPSIGTIDNPVIDAITGFLAYPNLNDTVGSIISSYVWRIRLNNTSDVYCYSMVRNGMFIYIPTATASRNLIIHRPFGAYKGTESIGGFSFFARIAVDSIAINTSIFVGLVSPNGLNTFSLDGSNTLTSTVEAVGFLIDRSIYGNWNVILLVRKASTTTMYQTTLAITPNYFYDLKIYWNNDYSTLNYAYGSTAGLLLTYTPITTFSTNPSNDILYDPSVSVNRPSDQFGMAINRISMVHEEIL